MCLALAAGTAARAQASGPDPKRAAQALYERYVKALGGARALAGVHSRSVKGTLEYTGVDQHAIVHFETFWVAPDRLAQAMRAPFGVVTRVYDGERGVGIHPQTGRRDLDASEVAEVMRDGARVPFRIRRVRPASESLYRFRWTRRASRCRSSRHARSAIGASA